MTLKKKWFTNLPNMFLKTNGANKNSLNLGYWYFNVYFPFLLWSIDLVLKSFKSSNVLDVVNFHSILETLRVAAVAKFAVTENSNYNIVSWYPFFLRWSEEKCKNKQAVLCEPQWSSQIVNSFCNRLYSLGLGKASNEQLNVEIDIWTEPLNFRRFTRHPWMYNSIISFSLCIPSGKIFSLNSCHFCHLSAVFPTVSKAAHLHLEFKDKWHPTL